MSSRGRDRDTFRTKVYEAEDEVARMFERPGSVIEMFGTQICVPDERRFGRVSDADAFVKKVYAFLGYEYPPEVVVRKGQTKATYNRSSHTIRIPDQTTWALREMVVLHEVAHALTPPEFAAHGREFRSNFCDLLEKVLAPEARFLVQVAYFDRGLTG